MLESGPDDISPLDGGELVRRKVQFYCVMGGDFSGGGRPEYNVREDLPSANKIFERWPVPVVASGFEAGLSVLYPAESIERDFCYTKNHPVAEAYRLFGQMPYNRPCWDLTAVFYAVYPDRGYFGMSAAGRIILDAGGRSFFKPDETGTLVSYRRSGTGGTPSRSVRLACILPSPFQDLFRNAEVMERFKGAFVSAGEREKPVNCLTKITP